MNQVPDLLKLAKFIETAVIRDCRAVAGFDGFVDEMISLVGERRSLADFTPVPDIATFGRQVTSAAGHSSLREIVVNDTHPGGCAVNLADGLASLGVCVDCFATLGDPVHPAFHEIAAKCHGFHSWGGEPGRTLAFEFNDGKLMFSAVRHLVGFTPEAARGFLENGYYQGACAEAQVIALTDWTLYPAHDRYLEVIAAGGIRLAQASPAFSRRFGGSIGTLTSDILEVAGILHDFEPSGSVTLGLNGNEANILCRLHGLASATPEATPDETLVQAAALQERLEISRGGDPPRRFRGLRGCHQRVHSAGGLLSESEKEHRSG